MNNTKKSMNLRLTFLNLFLSLIAVQSYAVTDERTVYQYGYDRNGNTTTVHRLINQVSQLLYTYRYNNLNQMVGFEDIQNQRSYSHLYYPDGRRLSKQGYRESDQEAIVFYYGHYGQLMNESYSKNNQIQKQSSYFAGLRFVDDLENHNDSHIQYPMADQHNHPATLSFAQGGSRIESYQLTDYGQLAQSNIKQTEMVTQTNQLGLFNFELNPKVYGSGYYDSESNLQYMGARYYSADIQRFMAQDSYNLLNRYNYANANPVMNYDPDGHSSLGSIINIGMLAVGMITLSPKIGEFGAMFSASLVAQSVQNIFDHKVQSEKVHWEASLISAAITSIMASLADKLLGRILWKGIEYNLESEKFFDKVIRSSFSVVKGASVANIGGISSLESENIVEGLDGIEHIDKKHIKNIKLTSSGLSEVLLFGSILGASVGALEHSMLIKSNEKNIAHSEESSIPVHFIKNAESYYDKNIYNQFYQGLYDKNKLTQFLVITIHKIARPMLFISDDVSGVFARQESSK